MSENVLYVKSQLTEEDVRKIVREELKKYENQQLDTNNYSSYKPSKPITRLNIIQPHFSTDKYCSSNKLP